MKLKSLLLHFAPEIILTIYMVLFFVVKNPNNPNDRVIMSDGKGYYGFITAILIYHDLEYRFIEEYESKYYPDDPTIFKEYRFKFRGETVNKVFPGMAFLMLPFFLIAHFLSFIFGFPTDGYSIIYQYCIGFSALFYLWLGLRFLRKLMFRFSFSEKVTAVLASLLLGFIVSVRPTNGMIVLLIPFIAGSW